MINYSDSTKDFNFSFSSKENNELELSIKTIDGSILTINSNDVNHGTFYCLKLIEFLISDLIADKNCNCYEL